MQTTSLNIVKASAGSGKTFRLVRFYLELCFKNIDDPYYFSHILAITFTNKATQEMQERILDEVRYLADPQAESDHRDYLMDTCDLTLSRLTRHAEKMKRNMIFNYEQIAVSTIDSFFQKVLRGFARDLGLDTSYQIQVKSDKILEEAVDLLIKDLDKKHPMYFWLEQELETKIAEGSNFELRGSLLSMAKETYSEEVEIDEPEKLDQKLFLKMYKYNKNREKELDNEFSLLKQQMQDLLDKYNINYEEFKNKGGGGIGMIMRRSSAGEFEGLINSSWILAILEDVSGLHTKKAIKSNPTFVEKCIAFYNDGGRDLTEKIYAFAEKAYTEYMTIKAIQENFVNLLTVSFLLPNLTRIRRRENWMVLAETNKFLLELMKDMSIPFLYEKIARDYQHILIDEFQDTSAFQWLNLKTLIDENIASQNSNLLVGDVKQAIYRFRNGQWSLLHSDVKTQYGEDELREENLDSNYRSDGQIINFNNLSFASDGIPTLVESALQQQISSKCLDAEYEPHDIEQVSDIYIKSDQKIPRDEIKDKGYVEISFLNSDEKEDLDEEDDFDFDVLYFEKIYQILKSTYERGYQSKDIAFLCKTKKQLNRVVDMIDTIKMSDEDGEFVDFLTYVNNEALLLSSNHYIRYIMANLRMMQEPDLLLHHVEVLESIGVDPAEIKDKEDIEIRIAQWQEIHQKVSGSSLLEIAQVLLNHYPTPIPTTDSLYVQAFLEEILQYQTENGSFLPDFLNWWDEEQPIMTLPEGLDAIKMMTLHSAKGLEFPVVIMPEVNWKFNPSAKNKTFLWVDHLFDGKAIKLPITWSLKYLNSKFRDEIYEECKNALIDKLNLLYVGFTRSKNELYLICDKYKLSSKGEKPLSMNTLLQDFYVGNSNYFSSMNAEDHDITLSRGKQDKHIQKEVAENDVLELAIPEFRTELPQLRMPAWEEDTLSQDSVGKFKLVQGNIIHLLLEQVDDIYSVDKALKYGVVNGLYSQEEEPQWRDHMRKLFSVSGVKELFDPSNNILSERKIYASNGKKYIPDRVIINKNEVIIIDYKSGRKQDSHQRQLSNYRRLYEEMGYQNIQTYVLYTHLFELLETH